MFNAIPFIENNMHIYGPENYLNQLTQKKMLPFLVFFFSLAVIVVMPLYIWKRIHQIFLEYTS